MSNNSKTLRLLFPQWQGGINPNYYFAPKLLEWLAPADPNSETAEVPVAANFETPLKLEYDFYAGNILVEQAKAAAQLLEIKRPDRIITFGGECSVSQAPFDYLHGRYPEHMGILWVDAHPDISQPQFFQDEHAMVLGSLLGEGAPEMAALVKHPYTPDQVLYAGLIADEMLDYEQDYMKKTPMPWILPERLTENSDPVLQWLKEKDIRHLCIHFDVDALTPEDFRSELCNEPHLGPVDYAVGKLTLKQVTRLLQDVSAHTDVVGLTISEYMPWDAIALHNAMRKIPIFGGNV